LDDIANALHGFRLRGVKRGNFAKNGQRATTQKACLNARVDTEFGTPVALSRLQTPCVVADDGESSSF